MTARYTPASKAVSCSGTSLDVDFDVDGDGDIDTDAENDIFQLTTPTTWAGISDEVVGYDFGMFGVEGEVGYKTADINGVDVDGFDLDPYTPAIEILV